MIQNSIQRDKKTDSLQEVWNEELARLISNNIMVRRDSDCLARTCSSKQLH
jgi:hypothetical protein